MIRSFFIISTFIFTASVMAQTNVRLHIKKLPAYHPSGSNIYVAGSFNGWNPQDENFKFNQGNDGSYFLVMHLKPGNYEYKITRGGWDKVECKTGGSNIENRVLNVEENAELDIDVEEWVDRFPTAPKKSTASKNVYIVDPSFLMPQLKRTRRIWIYLPANYYSGKKRFPVIYMHDGQNVFDSATSFSGEWGVDEYLDSLGDKQRQWIVVAVDNGGTKRLNEYCPYDFILDSVSKVHDVNKGEGNEYVDFLVKTLKPFIDKKYRTETDKANTAIAGSSMGGLISLYATLKYPKVFGTTGVFSPAFWLAPQIFTDIEKKGKKVSSKIYFYAGKLENEVMTSGTVKAYEAMSKLSKATMQKVIRDDGKHNEATWRTEFALFYQWMNQK